MGCASSKKQVAPTIRPAIKVSAEAAAQRAAWQAEAEEAAAQQAREVEETARRDAALSNRGCTIAETPYRAITLRQLREVGQQIVARCEAEQWEGDVRQPDGSFARVRLTPMTVNLYHLNELFIKPRTLDRKCSYVELVASSPQKPDWFVSHWWGEPVLLFLRCLERHAADHTYPGEEVDENTAYWVCAYANNQHELGTDVDNPDPSQSAFARAIKLARKKVLSVIDEEGVTYSRIWWWAARHSDSHARELPR